LYTDLRARELEVFPDSNKLGEKKKAQGKRESKTRSYPGGKSPSQKKRSGRPKLKKHLYTGPLFQKG